MADSDSDFDPNPMTATVGASDPLVDWASNQTPDTLAKFIHSPEDAANDMAAKGMPPPSPEVMQAMHDHNASQGTPTQDPAAGNMWNIPMGLGGGSGSQPQYRPPTRSGPTAPDAGPDPTGGPVGVGPPQGPLAGAGQTLQNIWDRAKGIWQQGGFDPNAVRTQIQKQTVDPSQAPALSGGPVTPATAALAPKQQEPFRPHPGRQYLPPHIKRGGHDIAGPEPGGGGTPDAEAEKAAAPPAHQPTGREVLEAQLGGLGKALQGVKAPEPLKPPSSFAPSPGRPGQIQAASIPQLLAMLTRTGTGQVPASAMPILRMLGR